MACTCGFVKVVVIMSYLSEQMLFDYILCGAFSFEEVKSALQIDYIEHDMDSLRYSYNLRLLFSHFDRNFGFR